MMRPVERQSRNANGAYQMSEFAVAVFCLFLFIILPLVNLSIVPMRYGLAKSLVEDQLHRLAKAELLSQALAPGLNLTDALGKIGGIEVVTTKTVLEIEAAKKPQEKKQIAKVGAINTDWLPDGPLGPYLYRLASRTELKIAPLALVKLGGLNVPGLTAPLPVTLDEKCVFENLGRDPNTGEYFINE
jgi:hypothetical protein